MKPLRNKIIVIDPGHGGHDSGAVGNGIKEKDVVLSLGLRLGSMLRALGATVIFTRTTDVYVTLGERADIANKAKADIFISVHVNAGGGVTANGVEIFSHPTSIPGMELSKAVLTEILRANIFKVNRGNKTANFAVLRLTNMPAILSETGFVDHYGDSQIIKNKEEEIAESILKGVCMYFGVNCEQPIVGGGNSMLYRVRKSWENAESQKGAYTVLESAIVLAKELGFNVYDDKGVKVYPEKEQWAEASFKNLLASGVDISERRFEDTPTRGEMFAFGDSLLKAVKKKMI